MKDCIKRFNQAFLEVEYPSDKIVIMAMMEGLRPGPLFDSLSKKVPATLLALQSKADKYITAEELDEAKRGGEERMTIKGRVHLASDEIDSLSSDFLGCCSPRLRC